MNCIISLILALFSIGPPSFMNKSPKEGLWEAMEYYNIHHKEIVYSQAVLETNNFKSNLCCNYNNLFGLRGRHYYKYRHWSESVKAYKEKIQSRYKSGEDYYKFLKRIHYATNPNYNSFLRNIVRKEPWK